MDQLIKFHFLISAMKKVKDVCITMTTYHSHALDLSAAQMQKLAAGRAIRLKAAQLTGSDHVFLTETQIKRLQKAQAAGKGADLQLSNVQVEYNSIHGSGRFGDWLRGAWNTVKDTGKKAVNWISNNYGQQLVDAGSKAGAQLIDKAADRIQDKVQTGVARLPVGIRDTARDMTETGIALGNTLARDELRKLLEGIQRSTSGRGLFDFLGSDVGGFLNDAGNSLLGIAKDVAIPLITTAVTKKLGGRGASLQHGGELQVKRGRGRPRKVVYDGSGLYPPGHYGKGLVPPGY